MYFKWDLGRLKNNTSIQHINLPTYLAVASTTAAAVGQASGSIAVLLIEASTSDDVFGAQQILAG